MTHTIRHMLLLIAVILLGGNHGAYAAPEAHKQYKIQNVNTGKYLNLQTNYNETNSINATPLLNTPAYFVLEKNDKDFYAFCCNGLYMTATGANNGWNTYYNANITYQWTFEQTATAGQYYIHCASGYLKYDGTNNYAYTNGTEKNDKSVWKLIEVPFTITYQYIDADHDATIVTTETFNLAYEEQLPSPTTPTGYTVLSAPSGKVTGNSTYTILLLDNSVQEPAPATKPSTVALTYRYVSPEGQVWFTEDKGSVANDAAYPDVVSAPFGISFNKPQGNLSETNASKTIDIPCTLTGELPFTFATSYDEIESWYNIDIHKNYHYLLNYDAQSSNDYMELNTTTKSNEEKYLFAFVGNPFEGFSIFNKAAGESMILSSTKPDATQNTGGNNYIKMRAAASLTDSYNRTWDFKSSNGGFYISRHGDTETHKYANLRDAIINGKKILAYWTGNEDDGSTFTITEAGITTVSNNPSGTTPSANKVYRIYNKRVAGKMIYETEDNKLEHTNRLKTGDYSQLWVVENNTETAGAFTIRNAKTGRFVKPNNKDAVAETSETATALYFPAVSNYFGIGTTADGSGDKFLNTNPNTTNIVSWTLGSDQGSGWIFEEVESSEATYTSIKEYVKAHSPYAELSSGKYYRLVNKQYPDFRMVENYYGNEKVSALSNDNTPNLDAQIWKIVGNNTIGYTLQNAFTGHYIKDQASQSQQFSTTTDVNSAKAFLVTTSGNSEWGGPNYAFYRSSSDIKSLHCDNSKNVVSWNYNADASWWKLEPVELSNEQIEAIHETYEAYKADLQTITDLNANAEQYNAALANVFTDAACTELKESYRNLSDYRLGVALAALGLPSTIQEMAIYVKNNTWEPEHDAEYNNYVRKFRIAEYEPYSDRHVWNNLTKVGAFGQAINPTGITVKAGDALYVYVDDNVKDSDAVLKLEIVAENNATGTQSAALHKGLNTYTAPHNGEVFVFYNVTNPNKYVSATNTHEADYPNIRIHIEGGKASGMWDAHRGMTDSEWDYLCQNMLTADYLHIKGNNTIINCFTEKARGAQRLTDVMKIWDYIFMTEERLIGNDGQWDGRYKPVMTVRDQVSGNPNWSGTCINLNDINKNGLLNFESLMNERWVIYHEEAHGHQYPINLVATTESSNNGFAQMVNHEFGISSRRNNGVKTLIDFKNNGWGWVDILRGGEGTSRSNGFKYYDDALWLQNHLFYQLYLYFHAQNKMPDFWPRLCDEMRSNGGLIQHGNDANNPTLYYEDYLKFAEACAKVSQTDLCEFFETWGFFGYYDEVKVGNDYTGFSSKDNEAAGIRYVGDYGNYYLKMPVRSNADDVKRINDLKAYMKGMPKKAPNIMFIDDHILDREVAADCFAATLDPSRVGQPVAFYGSTPRQGDFGDYTQFSGTNNANAINYTISGTTVTMQGDGLVGVKIYDAEGNLKYIYNTTTFTVPSAVATGLSNGTFTLVAALGDDTNLPIASPSTTKYDITVYNGSADHVQHYKASGTTVSTTVPYTANAGCDIPALEGNAMMLLPGVNTSSYFSLPKALKTANVFCNNGTTTQPEWSTMTLNLTDKADFYLPEGVYQTSFASYRRTNTAGLNSVCLPFDVEASAFGEGTKIYEFSFTDGDRISFVEVQKAEAGKFYIVECPAALTEWNIVVSEAAIVGQPSDGTDAVGTFCSTALPDGVYKLNADGTKFGITSNGKGSATAFRGYFNPATPLSASAMPFTLVELGDVNGDGHISVADVTELVDRLNDTLSSSNRRSLPGASTITQAYERQAQHAADVNCDGQLTTTDMDILLKRLLNK